MLGQRERIARPASVVKGNGIGMARQQQTASTLSGAGQHIEFIARTGDCLNLNLEAQIFKPVCQQSD